jgi:hypothetical protein
MAKTKTPKGWRNCNFWTTFQKSGEGGIRTTLPKPVKTRLFQESSPESGATTLQNLAHCSDLVAVVEAWPKLPDAIRAGVLAIVKAAGG